MADIEGFKTKKYPDAATGKDVPLYVCTKCTPDWDTFDADLARSHTEIGAHNQIGKPYAAPPPGQVMP